MAKPAVERILTAPHQAMGVDLYQSSKVPLFRPGAKVWGYLYDSAEYLDPESSKNIKSDGMEYIYARLNRINLFGEYLSAAAGMYGEYNPDAINIYIAYIDDNAYNKIPDDDVMVICHVGPQEYAWFLVLNGDPVYPLNPKPLNPNPPNPLNPKDKK